GFQGDPTKVSADEHFFIVIHQVYELWFKLALRDLSEVRDSLGVDRVSAQAVSTSVGLLRRVVATLEMTLQQFELLTNLEPQSFLAFRDTLRPASGVQSYQWRMIECMMGLSQSERDEATSRLGDMTCRHSKQFVEVVNRPLEACKRMMSKCPMEATDDETTAKIEAFEEDLREHGTIREVVFGWLARLPIHMIDESAEEMIQTDSTSWACKQRFLDKYLENSPSNQRALLELLDKGDDAFRKAMIGLLAVETYPDFPIFQAPHALIEAIVRVDSAMTTWRHLHARVVERTIGVRSGTMGSGGYGALDVVRDTFRLFPEIPVVRGALILGRDVPLLNARAYGFVSSWAA
ncbi:MAG: tryptophan 2,3-dioxygenase family protein, partial [Myxococcota bacterium]